MSLAARECIADAKVLLAVATEEPFGLTVVEAFREGTAVVLGSGGYTLEESWSADGAVALADREVVALRHEVERLLKNPPHLAAIADAGRRWALRHASVDAMSERISRDLTGSVSCGNSVDESAPRERNPHMSTHPKVVIWRSNLLMTSETFVANQAAALQRWHPRFAALEYTRNDLGVVPEVRASSINDPELLRLIRDSDLVHAHFALDGSLLHP